MRFFRKIYEYWMAFGHAIGAVMTPFWLLLVYLFVFGPARLVTVLMRLDLLDRAPAPAATFWCPKPPRPDTLEEARHQF